MGVEREMIRTEFIHPPVPERIYDWMAWVEGEEESQVYGYGKTEIEALRDLCEQLAILWLEK